MNAQPLRYLDLLKAQTIKALFAGVEVSIPHPANFAVHKLIVASRRSGDKKENDRLQAVAILRCLIDEGRKDEITDLLGRIPAAWKKTALAELKRAGDPNLLTSLLPK